MNANGTKIYISPRAYKHIVEIIRNKNKLPKSRVTLAREDGLMTDSYFESEFQSVIVDLTNDEYGCLYMTISNFHDESDKIEMVGLIAKPTDYSDVFSEIGIEGITDIATDSEDVPTIVFSCEYPVY